MPVLRKRRIFPFTYRMRPVGLPIFLKIFIFDEKWPKKMSPIRTSHAFSSLRDSSSSKNRTKEKGKRSIEFDKNATTKASSIIVNVRALLIEKATIIKLNFYHSNRTTTNHEVPISNNLSCFRAWNKPRRIV